MSKVLNIGAALMDLLIEESDEFVKSLGVEKGGMNLVELQEITEALKKTSQKYVVVPGGSACNTAVGLANLGLETSFIGVIGEDKMGQDFSSNLNQVGVIPHLKKTDAAQTGQVLSVVTPDAERTMFTYLGASSTASPDILKEEWFHGVEYVLIEGYLAFNAPYYRAVIEMAKTTGAKVCLDLASFDVVQICRELLDETIPKIDVLIANEDEAKAFTGLEEDEALEELAKLAEIAVVKIGKKGSLIANGQNRYQVAAEVVEALDTTGAGDLWASGFLYGLVNNWSFEQCAKLGSQVSSEVVQVMGTTISDSGWKRIKGSQAFINN